MRRFLPLFLLAIAANCFAEEIPAGYYDSADGKKDAELKTALHKIIKVGERYTYGSRDYNKKHSKLRTWDGIFYTDMRTDGTIYDMYGTRRHYMQSDTIGGLSTTDIDIEHSFPKSWWGGKDNDAYKDLHHLCPADSKANSMKNNNGPGYVNGSTSYKNDIFKVGTYKEQGGITVFEPADQYKGDFARMYFYIVTCYQDSLTWDAAKTKNHIDGSDYLVFKPWVVEMLLKWHRDDPVSRKEIKRQDAVSSIQHNRNPYIDYPELVEYIWGDKKGTAVDLSSLILTSSDKYTVPADTDDTEAFAATDVTDSTFIAHWSYAGDTEYELNVYTKTVTGKNDTLLNYPVVCSAIINSDKEPWLTGIGSGLNANGASSVNFGTSSNDFTLKVTPDEVPANTRLVLRACYTLRSNGNENATIVVKADGKEIQTFTTTLDEEYYSADIPQGTKEILISQGKKTKRFTLQQLFLISGEEKVEQQPISGYPKFLNAETSQEVKPAKMPADSVFYYTVTPKDLRTSNEIKVKMAAKKEEPKPDDDALQIVKPDYNLFTQGLNVTITGVSEGTNIQAFDITGRIVASCVSNGNTTLTMPATGVYIIRINQNTQKIIL